MKRTSIKIKKISLKKSPLTVKNYKGLKKVNTLKQISSLQSNNSELQKTELKKQNEKSKEKWEKVRNQILERDNFKCIVCGKPATQVHHIHLRSKRKDLLYEFNNLVSLCDLHHDHHGNERLEKVNYRIAFVKHMTLEELLKFAEIKSGE